MNKGLGQDQEWSLSSRQLNRDGEEFESFEEQEPSNVDYRPRWLPRYDTGTLDQGLSSQSLSSYAYQSASSQRSDLALPHPAQTGGHTSNPAPTFAGSNFVPQVVSPSWIPPQLTQLSFSTPTYRPSQHVKVTRTRQTSKGDIPHTYITPARIRFDQDVNENEQKLYDSMLRRQS